MKVAVVGATGLVGGRMLRVLEERDFPVSELIPVASERSAGKKIRFKNREYTVIRPEEAIEKRPDIALFSAGSDASRKYAPLFAERGCYVIDNSACWRMDPDKKLVIPEINGDVIERSDHIIANPNCSTIQMLIAVAGLHRKYKIKRIVVSTYQCITGTGQRAVEQMEYERTAWTAQYLGKEEKAWGKAVEESLKEKQYSCIYPYPIDLNLLPHIDKFTENGYTKEEMKMVNETHKIMRDNTINVSPTAVRVPVLGGHAESLNIEFEKPFEIEDIFKVLARTEGVRVQDNPSVVSDTPQESLPYPMPLYSEGHDEVFVGRIRRDFSLDNGLNLWCVADNLRKGAATNAVQIAELLVQKFFC